jgi:shikimate dehydrogenase
LIELKITGTTRVIGVIADPIDKIMSPQAHNPLFESDGIDVVMIPMHVAAADLEVAWAGLRAMRNLVGVGITAPHKITSVALCDELTETARFVGAINIARRDAGGRMVGGNFDGDGFVAGLRATGRDPRGMRVLLLGAGGAAHALGFALAHAGVRRLAIVNRSAAKAEALVQRVLQAVPDLDCGVSLPDPRGCDLVVNATSLGMADGDGAPLRVELLQPSTLVADLIMQPETLLLREAVKRGCTVHPGRLMLDCQLALRLAFLGLTAQPMGPQKGRR